MPLCSGAHYCRALYDYEATCPEELTLVEDQIVHVLRTVGHDGVDDGWWEGQLDGSTGLFPSLVVEDCHANGDPLTPEVSPRSSAVLLRGQSPVSDLGRHPEVSPCATSSASPPVENCHVNGDPFTPEASPCPIPNPYLPCFT